MHSYKFPGAEEVVVVSFAAAVWDRHATSLGGSVLRDEPQTTAAKGSWVVEGANENLANQPVVYQLSKACNCLLLFLGLKGGGGVLFCCLFYCFVEELQANHVRATTSPESTVDGQTEMKLSSVSGILRVHYLQGLNRLRNSDLVSKKIQSFLCQNVA